MAAKSEGTKKTAPKVKEAEKQVIPEKADAIKVTIGDQTSMAIFKTFSTGSRGWHASGKVTINGLRCQMNTLVTIIGSKNQE